MKKDAFHPHPLTLEDDPEALLVCDGCQELCYGLSYRCSLCKFNLDIRCAELNEELAKHEVQKAREIKATVNHFSHFHQLIRCLKDMLTQVQSPFHPQHSLLHMPIPFETKNADICNICAGAFKGIAFICFQCEIAMHCSCAMYQTRKIKHDCHVHHLLFLGKSIFVKSSPKCSACHTDCSDTLFCCKDCKFYVHLECMPLPYILKHRRHLHPLTLTHSIVEDDFEEYYCDMCEAKRNPEHDVYYCKECTYIAHVDCVISELS
ncbi:hypothetical protein DITRI_Ditri15bG0028300 [Diplodiscus trichospermus]